MQALRDDFRFLDRSNCEICPSEIKSTDKHHIHSRSKGGSNLPWNKARICPNCHRLVHTGELIIEGRFHSTGGNILVYRKKGEESVTGLPDPIVWLYSENGKKVENLKEIKKPNIIFPFFDKHRKLKRRENLKRLVKNNGLLN